MNQHYFFICFLLVFTNLSASTFIPADSVAPRPYELRLTQMPGAGISLNGYLGALNDSSVTILKGNRKRYLEPVEVPVSQIEKLKFREVNSVGRGVLYGGLVGFATGFVFGLAQGGSPPCEPGFGPCFHLSAVDVGVLNGLAAGGVGMIIGGIIGSLRVNIPIKGKQKEYEQQRQVLEQYRF